MSSTGKIFEKDLNIKKKIQLIDLIKKKEI